MGSGLVRRLTAAGHTVLLTDHNADKAANVAAQARDGQPGRASAAEDAEALAADVVVLAIWYPGTVEYARANSAALSGKVVVDISNPLDDSFTGLTIDPTTSAAEQLAAALPDSSVVKAFNTVTSTVLPVGELDGTPSDTFVASDDDKAKATVLELLEGTGLRGLDAGKLSNARLLERLTAFGIELGQRYGLEFDFAFKYLPATEMTPNG
jgi:8-hydroxy-5-deazaflavin:NADPH oxidoreductase